MEAYISGDYKTGEMKMIDTKQLFKTALSDCKTVGEQMEKWAGSAEDMMAKADYAKFTNQIYAANISVINKYISHESSR